MHIRKSREKLEIKDEERRPFKKKRKPI